MEGQTWTDLGESDWSETSPWEHGLLAQSDWTSQWIAPIEADDLPARQRPAYQLAGAVRIDSDAARPRLYVTAHAVYEAFINGTRVGDLELTPGWTAYRTGLQVQTYDVTDLVTAGDNIVGALLSDVDGYEGTLRPDDIIAVVVHTDLEHRGSFGCSDERINEVHRIAEWSFRDNACDIPTDCPTRERVGWTGDWQLYVETAAFPYDVGGFSVKWLRLPDGSRDVLAAGTQARAWAPTAG